MDCQLEPYTFDTRRAPEVRVPLTPGPGYAVLLREKSAEQTKGGIMLPASAPEIDPHTGRPTGRQEFMETGMAVGAIPMARVLRLGKDIPSWKEGMLDRPAEFKVGDRVLLTNSVSRFTHLEIDGNILEVAPFEAVIAVLEED